MSPRDGGPPTYTDAPLGIARAGRFASGLREAPSGRRPPGGSVGPLYSEAIDKETEAVPAFPRSASTEVTRSCVAPSDGTMIVPSYSLVVPV